ncbi:glycosyltransferase family 4 protein, partial [bacterium]|nr:glycosyltransferase family 4 protein [bacterium]
NINSNKINVIYHGIDNDFFVQNRRSEKFEDRSYVLMLGGDSYQKNPEGAIAAWAKVPIAIRKRYPLKVVGFCGNERSPLIQAIRKHGLNDEVEIKGWVTQKELIDNFRNAVIFLCLSRYEGFGFPLLQAMATGTPVISTNRASLPEVLEDVGFQFNPDDYQGIANAIAKLLQDRCMWDMQSAAGIKRAEMFTWRRCAQEHIRVYEEVLRDK